MYMFGNILMPKLQKEIKGLVSLFILLTYVQVRLKLRSFLSKYKSIGSRPSQSTERP